MKKNEQVLEAWLQMTTVINNERITSDLPYNESMICRYLYQNQDKNVTATDLCNWMRMQKSQMNRTLTSMEKKDLITRIRSEQDTRKIYITLNDSMPLGFCVLKTKWMPSDLPMRAISCSCDINCGNRIFNWANSSTKIHKCDIV